MTCSSCGGDTKVINSRFIETERVIRRRRVCLKCESRTNTFEIVGELYLAMLETYRAIKKLETATDSLGGAIVSTRVATDALRDVIDDRGRPNTSVLGEQRFRALLGSPLNVLSRPDE